MVVTPMVLGSKHVDVSSTLPKYDGKVCRFSTYTLMTTVSGNSESGYIAYLNAVASSNIQPTVQVSGFWLMQLGPIARNHPPPHSSSGMGKAPAVMINTRLRTTDLNA